MVKGEQPQKGAAVLGAACYQQLHRHLHPVGTLNQQEPGLKHCVLPPKGHQENAQVRLESSTHQCLLWRSDAAASHQTTKSVNPFKQFARQTEARRRSPPHPHPQAARGLLCCDTTNCHQESTGVNSSSVRARTCCRRLHLPPLPLPSVSVMNH